MTPFSIMCSFAGLSHREASDFLSVRIDTIKSWSSGRNPAPGGVIEELRVLIKKQDRAAAEALIQIEKMSAQQGNPTTIELGYPADDHEAQSLGWPCVGAWRAMAAQVIVESNHPVMLVPRGSTPATAAAADSHKK